MTWCFRTAVSVVLAAGLFSIGCSRSSPTTLPAKLAESGLGELAKVYEYLAAQNLPPPRKVTDLDEHEANLPTSYAKIVSGEYVVIWGVGQVKGSTAVLAYEKDAATKGGEVLIQDGTIKTMTAAEFQSARKAR